MPTPTVSPAQHQLLDFAKAPTLNLGASASNSIQVQGTVWPLLPGLSTKVYQIGGVVNPANYGKVALTGIQMGLFLLDAGNNPIETIVLLGKSYPNNTLVGPGAGGSESITGDPLVHLAAGFLLTVTNRVAAIQIYGIADVTNTDAMNAQNVDFQITGLLSFATN